MNADPATPIEQLKGVGPKLRDTLGKLGIYRYADLLLHLPYRYQDRTHLRDIATLQAGDEALIAGRIQNTALQYGKRRSFKVTVDDGSGRVDLRFFHFSKYQQSQLSEATFIRAFGEFRYVGRALACVHPDYELFYEDQQHELSHTQTQLTPTYPTTSGLGQGRLRSLTSALCQLTWPDEDGTPYRLLQRLHQPPPDSTAEQIGEWQSQLATDELTTYYLVMQGRARDRRRSRTTPLPQAKGLGKKLLDKLGFTLTKAQAKVTRDILSDLEREMPMLRLVQGDVGSGKTVVAAFAAIRAAEHDAQVALMAPTELLAEQHFANFSEWLTPLDIQVTLLTGQLTAGERRARLTRIEQGEVAVVIGTHALFQQHVTFQRLALAIIDEQHRFGVHQRMALQQKGGAQPHQLVMTATPIPRTLTMALYADMDVSVIDELPPGRQPIRTYTVDQQRRSEVINTIHTAIAEGQQAYWVCTLIEDNDEIDALSVASLAQQLSDALPEQRIAILHGRMKSDEKLALMRAFKAHEIDILVATTVIEVGVDVANATHMVIENAERLGLAQLHQLRGRVGRGKLASHCYLMFKSGLSDAAKQRLHAMRDSQDGFYLAEQDLKIRGPGDLLGTRQAGEQSFRIADLARDAHLMPRVIQRGERLLNATPGDAEYVERQQLLRLWAPADGGHLSV